MPPQQPFSRRHGYSQAKKITIREGAPVPVRTVVLDTARELDWAPSSLRKVLCRVLYVRADERNFNEYPDIWTEVQALMYGCEWFKVYDIIEALHARFEKNDAENGQQDAHRFTEALNAYFVEKGIGWQLVGGEIITRGDEAFEAIVKEGTAALQASERPTAAKHLHEALQALSRRPEANLPGAVIHAMGSLECVARDLTGDNKSTLGKVLDRYPGLLPKPLDEGLSKFGVTPPMKPGT